MKRAYATLAIKAMDDTTDGKRTFTGIASTISTDRMDDIVVPKGAVFKLPLPLLWQHDSSCPIGWVTAARVSDTAIEVDCEVHNETEPGTLKDRLDEAWQSLKAKLVQGLSIGFNSIEYSRIDGTYGLKYLSWEWLELSPVTIPANQDSSITSIKAADTKQRAALGLSHKSVIRFAPPGASGTPKPVPQTAKGNSVMNIKEQIQAAQTKRTASIARMGEIMGKSGETGDTLDADQEKEYDDLEAEVATLDKHIKRLTAHDKMMTGTAASTATEVNEENDVTKGAQSQQRDGGRVISVSRNLVKGTAFTRFAMALAHSKGNLQQAENIAKRWHDTTPEVEQVLKAASYFGSSNIKAAVAAGNTSDTAWAGPLVFYENMASEFIDILRPMTILGKMTGLRKMPFNVRVAGKTQGSSAGWVGEGAPKPVSALAFNAVTLGHAKAAGIVVITQELARFSSPAAEALVADDLRATIAQFLDQQFIDPSVAAVASVSPASITNGLVAIQSTGNSLAQITNDVSSLMQTFIAHELDPTSAVWVMKPSTALALSLKRTSQDVFTFPDITAKGGEWFGLPVVTSNSVPGSVSGGSIIALVIQSEVFLADDGGITLDVSQEASVQMVSNPQAGAQSLVSLWQNNLVGLRAEREINWQRRRDAAVGYIDGVAY